MPRNEGSSLSTLLTRLRAATWPDRELDAEIEILFSPFLSDLPRSDAGGWLHPAFGLVAPPQEYTSSIDAAVALAERALPGWYWSAYSKDGYGLAHARMEEPEDTGRGTRADAPTPALALCIAIVEALEAKNDA
jgi:hypothetical protein